MTNKELLLAAQLLNEASDHYANHSCNDWKFPIDWTHEERVKFVKEFHEFNGDPNEFDETFLRLPDYAVMAFLASKLVIHLNP